MKPEFYGGLFIIVLCATTILFLGGVVIPNWISMQHIEEIQASAPTPITTLEPESVLPTNMTGGWNSGNIKPCTNLSPEMTAYYDTWLIQCMEIEPLPVSTPIPTPIPTPKPTPVPSLAREISNFTVNLPISGNLTISLYQNEAGNTCIEDLSYYAPQFMIVSLGRMYQKLDCSGPPFNILTPEEVIGIYNNRVKWYSPGGEIYEGQLKEKNRRITEEEFAKSKPKWDLVCREDICILTNIYNQSQLRYKVQNITVIREGKEGSGV